MSFLLANITVRTPTIIEEERTSWVEMISQANAMAEEIAQRLNDAQKAGQDVSDFQALGPTDNSTMMTLDEANKLVNKLHQTGGHILAAQGTFYALTDVAESIRSMSMWIVEAPHGRFFVTSNKSLTLRSRSTGSRVGAGWKNSDAMGLIALSPRYFLIMCYEEPHGIRITSATAEQVEGLNLETMLFANQEVYSRYKYQEAYEWMRKRKRWKL